MNLGYLLDSCFSYCLKNSTDTFKLKDIYNYLGNEQVDDVTKRNDFLSLRELTQVFYWSDDVFKLGIKVSTCKYYNHPRTSCKRENDACKYIHICDDAINYSHCKKLFECDLKHDIDDDEIKIACLRLELPYHQINKCIFANLIKIYLKQSSVVNSILDFAVQNAKISNLFVHNLISNELSYYFREALTKFYEKSIENCKYLFLISEDNSFSISFNVNICESYLLNYGSCQYHDCYLFHICENVFLNDNCKCALDHDLNSRHNIEIINDNCIIRVNRDLLLKVFKLIYERQKEELENSNKIIDELTQLRNKKHELSSSFDEWYEEKMVTISRLKAENLKIKKERLELVKKNEKEIDKLRYEIYKKLISNDRHKSINKKLEHELDNSREIIKNLEEKLNELKCNSDKDKCLIEDYKKAKFTSELERSKLKDENTRLEKVINKIQFILLNNDNVALTNFLADVPQFIESLNFNDLKK